MKKHFHHLIFVVSILKAFNEANNTTFLKGESPTLRNRIDIRLISNEKDCLKWISKRSYVSQQIFDNNSVEIR